MRTPAAAVDGFDEAASAEPKTWQTAASPEVAVPVDEHVGTSSEEPELAAAKPSQLEHHTASAKPRAVMAEAVEVETAVSAPDSAMSKAPLTSRAPSLRQVGLQHGHHGL